MAIPSHQVRTAMTSTNVPAKKTPSQCQKPFLVSTISSLLPSLRVTLVNFL